MHSQQQRSAHTRARILAAAESAFALTGYDATSLDAICTAAGVTKGAFYYHFASKEGLFLALLEEWLARLAGQFEQTRATGQTAPEALRALSPILGQVLTAGQGQLPIYLEFWVRALRDEAVRARLLEPYRHFNTFFADLIAAGTADGVFMSLDADLAGRVLVSFAIGLMVQGLMDSTGADWEAVGQAGLAWLLVAWQMR